jgi:hypothetical protein
MNEGGVGDLSKLPAEEDAQYLAKCSQLTELALDHAVPIIFAPSFGNACISLSDGRVETITVPPPAFRQIEIATGCLLQLGDEYFLVTAEHVLDKYEERLSAGESLVWQVGGLPFDPLRHVAWRGSNKRKRKDIVFLRMSEREAREACADPKRIISAGIGWPAPAPKEDEVVLLAGYPKRIMEIENNIITPAPLSAMLKVTRSIGDGTFKCRYECFDITSFDPKALPVEGLRGSTGGVSGGPVFRIGDSSYPFVFVGVISEVGGGDVDDADTYVIEAVDGVPSSFSHMQP